MRVSRIARRALEWIGGAVAMMAFTAAVRPTAAGADVMPTLIDDHSTTTDELVVAATGDIDVDADDEDPTPAVE